MSRSLWPRPVTPIITMPQTSVGHAILRHHTAYDLMEHANIEADPERPLAPFTMFSMSLVALPSALVGMLYLALAAPLLLRAPDAHHPARHRS